MPGPRLASRLVAHFVARGNKSLPLILRRAATNFVEFDVIFAMLFASGDNSRQGDACLLRNALMKGEAAVSASRSLLECSPLFL
jgi:hypothetical protein